MAFWFAVSFVLGWVCGMVLMKLVRGLLENDVWGILTDCASASYQSHLNAHGRVYQKCVDTVVGAVLCALAAGIVCLVFRDMNYKSLVPFAFTIVLAGCARHFGALAGTLGSVAAATIFAVGMFPPSGFQVSDHLARTALLVMTLTGVVLSWFIAASREQKRVRAANTAHL